jgi:amino acid adenylation domain-containing protein
VTSPSSERRERIAKALRDDFGKLFGLPSAQVDPAESFLALGADSLFLIRASRTVQERFGVRVSFRRMLDEVNTVNALATLLDAELPADEAPAPAAAAPPPAMHVTPSPAILPAVQAGGDDGALRRILAQQMELMSLQLEALGGQAAPAGVGMMTSPSSVAAAPVVTATVEAPETADDAADEEDGDGIALDARQAAHLEALATRLSARVSGSRAAAEANRARLADAAGRARFRLPWKALIHPLQVERGEGARVWDVDGNEYVDLALDGGALLFGHTPDFISSAVRDALAAGLRAGARTALAGEVAALVAELTGAERVCFTASRTEAVMAALRLARAVTERPRVVLFAGADHGTFDGTLARRLGLGGSTGALPGVPGIPAGMLQDVMVLEHGDPAALETLRARGAEVAAVLVEPFRGGRPGADPGEFLRALAAVCRDTGAALVLDETATGFRAAAGGAQARFGVRADLAVYGGVPGSGLPLGIVAGRAAYLAPVDGGEWSYGDDSFPLSPTTRVAGLGGEHPLALAAARAALLHLKAGGTALLEGVHALAAALAERLRDTFARRGAPLRVQAFGADLRIGFPAEMRAVDEALFHLHLRERGVHVAEGRVLHLSTAHREADVDAVANAVDATVAAMQADGFLGATAAAVPAEPIVAPAVAAAVVPVLPVALPITTVRDEVVAPSAACPGRRRSCPALSACPGATACGLARIAAGVREVPLTAGQRDLWLLSQLGDDASRACHESVVVRLRGAFDADALRGAVRELVVRHDALRTAFSPAGDVQRIHPPESITVEVEMVDVAGDGDGEARLTAALEAEVRAPFDLTRAPILRARVFRLGEEDHTVCLVMHHLLSDGWSNGVLLRELNALYAAAEAGIPADLPPVDRPAAAGDADRAEEDAALEFWRGELDGAAVVDLPADAPRRSPRRFAGALERQPLDPTLTRRLAQVGEAHGATAFAVMLAAFRLFLHRLSGQEDLVAGAVAAGTQRMDGGDAVGSYVDVLPLRSRLEGDPTFAALLADARGRLADAVEHGGVSLARLGQALALPRDPSRPPVVAAVLNFHRSAGTRFPFGLAEGEALAVHNGGAKFELAVAAVETAAGVRLEWEYRADLFEPETVRGWMDAFRALLQAVAEHPERRASELEMVSAEARELVLGAWSGAGQPAATAPAVHLAVAAQAARTPGADAVICGGRMLTYAELDARAGRLAARLRRLGVVAETRVALCLDRAPEMVVAMLAVLKAGGAYVPVDPEYPADRKAWMLADSGAKVLLTQPHLRDDLPHSDARVVVLEADAAADETEPGLAAEADVSPAALAYVLYTSGSTGRPKGVEVTHGALANHMAWMRRAFPLGADGAVLQKTPFAFDASVWEFWAPLLEGARLVLAAPGAHRAPAALVTAMRAEGITTLQAVPTLLRALAEAPGLEDCRALRRIYAGGEALERALTARLHERLPQVEVVNLYGPTESCIDASFHRCGADGAGAGEPIGRPVDGVRLYVLDGALRPLPHGIAGELCVGGVQVARGYARRAALTAERFVPDPFSGAAGARMYRTGDRARWKEVRECESAKVRESNGSAEVRECGSALDPRDSERTLVLSHSRTAVLEYLGRTDFQVKVRGFRVELGEVEAALQALPGVRAAAAGVHGEGDAARLVAWIVADGHAPAAAELRAGLRRTLPDGMLPAAFVAVDALPLTPSGKLDRRALPAPGDAAETFVPPSTPAEETIAALWTEVLGTERVGANDDFFALGGHSLAAMAMLARVEDVFGVALPLGALFDNPTVAGLAAAVEALRPAGDDDEMAAIERILREIEALPQDDRSAALSSD